MCSNYITCVIRRPEFFTAEHCHKCQYIWEGTPPNAGRIIKNRVAASAVDKNGSSNHVPLKCHVVRSQPIGDGGRIRITRLNPFLSNYFYDDTRCFVQAVKMFKLEIGLGLYGIIFILGFRT